MPISSVDLADSHPCLCETARRVLGTYVVVRVVRRRRAAPPPGLHAALPVGALVLLHALGTTPAYVIALRAHRAHSHSAVTSKTYVGTPDYRFDSKITLLPKSNR